MSKSKFYVEKNKRVTSDPKPIVSDERPITSIVIIENVSKCPSGFSPVLKTHDDDSDADLWKQQPIFGKKTSRYICVSKSGGLSSLKVTNICVTAVGELPPLGYCVITTTFDTNKPAWRRHQLCYELTHENAVSKPFVTDIVVCNNMQKMPSGFVHAGEINGMTICHKITEKLKQHVTDNVYKINQSTNFADVIERNNESYYENITRICSPSNKRACANVSSNHGVFSDFTKLQLKTDSLVNNEVKTDVLFKNSNHSDINAHNMHISPPSVPPRRQNSQQYSTYNTSWNALEGIFFTLNPKLCNIDNECLTGLPNIKKKTLSELNQQYFYNFDVEQQI